MTDTHVLLSRPEPQLGELADWFSATQLIPVKMPAFEFTATGQTVAPDAAWHAAPCRLLIFTSPRAVQFGLPALGEDVLRDSQAAAIGPATTRALADAGVQALQAPGPDYDSEALLATLEERMPEPGTAMILAAPGGRTALLEGLQARGWRARLLPVYRRELLEPDLAAVAALEGAGRVLSLWTSGTALDHIMDKLPAAAAEKIRAGRAIVVSGRLADLARKRGMKDVHVAPGASNEELFRCFRELGD